MSKRYWGLIYMILLALLMMRNNMSVERLGVSLSWEEQLHMTFAGVSAQRALYSIDRFWPMVIAAFFLMADMMKFCFWWRQDCCAAYKLRLRNVCNVVLVKYMVGAFVVLKYFLITVAVCLVAGRGNASVYSNGEIDAVKMLVRLLAFFGLVMALMLLTEAIFYEKIAIILVMIMVIISAFVQSKLFIGNYSILVREIDAGAEVLVALAAGIMLDIGVTLLKRRYGNGSVDWC